MAEVVCEAGVSGKESHGDIKVVQYVQEEEKCPTT